MNDVDVIEDVRFLDENGVDEVVAFNARKRHSEIQILGFVEVFRVRKQSTGRHFPARPFLGGCTTNIDVVAGQASIIRSNQITAFRLRDVIAVRCKRIRENVAGSVLVKPTQF